MTSKSPCSPRWACGAYVDKYKIFQILAVISLLAPLRASANPRPLPFTYIYETLGKGEAEIEQYVDMTPVQILSVSGDHAWYAASQFQTEFEYGITDRLELGLYVTLAPSNPAFTSIPTIGNGNGIKQRLRYRLAELGQWPVDVALYGEVSENEREVELEGKIIVQRHLGPLRIVANAWAEHEIEYNGEREWVLNPTAGAVLEVSPTVQPGFEYWMRAEYGDEETARTFNMGPHHFIGPTLLLQFGKLWWSTGAYARLDDMHRSAAIGDNLGRLWMRSVIGVGL
jgi:hypothetical protein